MSINAYVGNVSDSTVSVIDTSTNTVIATITVGIKPIDIAVTPDSSAVYVVNSTSPAGNVSVIDTSTNTVEDF